MAAMAAADPRRPRTTSGATDWPILTMLETAAVPGATVRPLVDPTPLYPWTMVRRTGVRHGLEALNRAADRLVEAERWLDPPADAWLPPADRDLS
jgi:hypothetical protein